MVKILIKLKYVIHMENSAGKLEGNRISEGHVVKRVVRWYKNNQNMQIGLKQAASWSSAEHAQKPDQ